MINNNKETKMDGWIKEIKNCKKINKNVVVKTSTNTTTTKLMEKLNNRKNIKNCEDNTGDYYTGIGSNDDGTRTYTNNAYKLEKNESLGIDRNTDRRLKSGKIKVDLRVDFHGLTLNEAFDLLKSSVENGYNNGLKLILFITGKGNGTKENRDSIKSLIGTWMKDSAISSKVIKYVDARQRDGGTGAIYVLLKSKKRG